MKGSLKAAGGKQAGASRQGNQSAVQLDILAQPAAAARQLAPGRPAHGAPMIPDLRRAQQPAAAPAQRTHNLHIVALHGGTADLQQTTRGRGERVKPDLIKRRLAPTKLYIVPQSC